MNSLSSWAALLLAAAFLVVSMEASVQESIVMLHEQSPEEDDVVLVNSDPKWSHGSQAVDENYSPVIFVPGDGGNQLQAKLNKTSKPHSGCRLTSDWYDIWLDMRQMLPLVIDCFVDNTRLIYDPKTRTSSNTPGVEIRVAGEFGSLVPMAYLDSLKIPGTAYFEDIIAALEKNVGLERDVHMLGVGFDFRRAPNELQDYFANFTNLIVEHYVKNNYRPVTLICHSMGCLNSLYLLNKQTEGWKSTFVRRLISLGAPWHGSFRAISAMLFGDNLGIKILSQDKLQELQKTMPSLMYLFPRAPTFSEDRVLVQSAKGNYTLKNLDQMFEEAQLPDQRNLWHDTRDIANSLKAPNVELWCLYGGGQPTSSKIIFPNSSTSKSDYKELFGDGDGTVNIESLQACELFQAQQDKPVYTRQFENLDHMAILKSSLVTDFISKHIMGPDQHYYSY